MLRSSIASRGPLALALCVALAGLTCATFATRPTLLLHDDELDYVAAAANLRAQGVLSFDTEIDPYATPSAYREPAYPALLALAWTVAGVDPPKASPALRHLPADAVSWRPIRILNLLLLAVAALAAGKGVAALSSPTGGVVAAALVLCSPALQAATAKSMAENLATAHVTLAGLCLLGLARRASWARPATLVVLGLLPLTRAEGVLLLAVGPLVDAWADRTRKPAVRLREAALLAAGLALPSALWAARNAVQVGHPVLADRSGLALAVRAELDVAVARFGPLSAALAWTPLEAAVRTSQRLAPDATWLDFRPLGGDNYYFRTLRRWREERMGSPDVLAIDAEFRRAALGEFGRRPWVHLRAAGAVAWRGLFAERTPGWSRPFDLTFLLGLGLASAFFFVTVTACARRSLPLLAFLAPAWVGFAFHVAATELLPRYAVPFLPLAWAGLALAVVRMRPAGVQET